MMTKNKDGSIVFPFHYTIFSPNFLFRSFYGTNEYL